GRERATSGRRPSQWEIQQMADPAVSTDLERRPQAEPPSVPSTPAVPEQERRRSGRVVVTPAAADKVHPSARATEDERFLEKPARSAFLDSDLWRALRILSEFVDVLVALASICHDVSVFGLV